jgi:hypothetical protein
MEVRIMFYSRCVRELTTVVMALAAATVIDAQPARPIPRAAAVVIDGRADDGEWKDAPRASSPNGLQVRLQHDGASLFVSVTAPADGFTSLCLGDSRAVRILHASAALGAVDYTPSGGAWVPAQKGFSYAMRNTALTAEAAAERMAYFAEHKWVASTVRMGRDRTQEFQIDLKTLPAGTRLAMGYYVLTGGGSVLTWPETMAADDGCGAIDLVRGAVPASLTFNPSQWMPLPIAP